jgi:hypothetical protein
MRLLKFPPDSCRSATVQLDMVLRVVPHLMTALSYHLGEGRLAAHEVTDHEKGRGHTLPGQRLENRSCGGGRGAIVEREINAPDIARPARH